MFAKHSVLILLWPTLDAIVHMPVGLVLVCLSLHGGHSGPAGSFVAQLGQGFVVVAVCRLVSIEGLLVVGFGLMS